MTSHLHITCTLSTD